MLTDIIFRKRKHSWSKDTRIAIELFIYGTIITFVATLVPFVINQTSHEKFQSFISNNPWIQQITISVIFQIIILIYLTLYNSKLKA